MTNLPEPPTPTPDDVLACACPDCPAGPDAPCWTAEGFHVARVELAALRATIPGTCRDCGKPLRYGYRARSARVTVWHPDPVDGAACPPLPDPTTQWPAYSAALARGLAAGEPGLDAFVPDVPTITTAAPAAAEPTTAPLTEVLGVDSLVVCPECAAGKPANCTGQALDPATDEMVVCPTTLLQWP